MADLDDFFAKKDRKKNKSTKKFSTTDEIAKKLEDNAKKTEKVKKERIPEGDEANTQAHDQDEWKDFEEEKKDYSGLKIGNLTIGGNSDGVSGAAENSSGDQQTDGEDAGQESEKKSGPWKKIDESSGGQQAPQEVKEEVKAPEAKKPDPPAKTGAYLPPSMRNPAPQQHQMPPSRLKSKAAPDIHNEEFFPTLSKTSDHKKNRSEGSFEVVSSNRSSSYRQADNSKISSSQGPKLNLGNRYNTLSNDS